MNLNFGSVASLVCQLEKEIAQAKYETIVYCAED